MTYLLLIFLLLFPPSIWAVTIDAQTDAQGAINVLSKAHTTGSGSNRGGVLGCAVRHNTVTLTATYAGNAMTEIRRDQAGGNNNGSWLFYIVNPTSGSNNWEVTQSGGNSFNIICHFTTYTDSNQSSPVTNSQGSCTTGTSHSATVTTATNELLIDTIGISAVSVTLSQGANQTDISALPVEQGGILTGGGSTQAGADGGAMSWSWTGSNVACMSAVSIAHQASVRGAVPVWFQ